MEIREPNKYGNLSEERLQEFEKRIGVKLPQQYREFLLKYNGGEPFPRDFKFEKDEGSGVHGQFYGLHNGPDYSQMVWNYECFFKRIPKHLLAIAGDSFGNQICIGLKGKYQGEIYFWDHEVHDREGMQGIHLLLIKIVMPCEKIAESFNEFLDSLYEFELPGTPFWEKIIKNDDLKTLTELIDKGLDIETRNDFGHTLLAFAAACNSIKTVKMLLERGATSIEHALELAENNLMFNEKYKEVVELLKTNLKKV